MKLFSSWILIKSQIRKIYFFYSKFMLVYFHKVKIQLNKNFFPPDYPDLYNLFRLAMKIKPNVSLEVGTGYSTLVLAEALKRLSERDTGGGGFIIPWSKMKNILD